MVFLGDLGDFGSGFYSHLFIPSAHVRTNDSLQVVGVVYPARTHRICTMTTRTPSRSRKQRPASALRKKSAEISKPFPARSEATTVFQNGNSQAVRIPKNLRLDCKTVLIRREGDALIIEPLPADSWDAVFAGILPDATIERPPQPPVPKIRRWDNHRNKVR